MGAGDGCEDQAIREGIVGCEGEDGGLEGERERWEEGLGAGGESALASYCRVCHVCIIGDP
jgi:hypothetical protein